MRIDQEQVSHAVAEQMDDPALPYQRTQADTTSALRHNIIARLRQLIISAEASRVQGMLTAYATFHFAASALTVSKCLPGQQRRCLSLRGQQKAGSLQHELQKTHQLSDVRSMTSMFAMPVLTGDRLEQTKGSSIHAGLVTLVSHVRPLWHSHGGDIHDVVSVDFCGVAKREPTGPNGKDTPLERASADSTTSAALTKAAVTL